MASDVHMELTDLSDEDEKNPRNVTHRAEHDTIEESPRIWAEEVGLMCRRCVKFIQEPGCSDDDPLCSCGYKRSDHSEDAINSASSNGAERWEQKTHTEAMPTNAIGKMYFKGFRQKYTKYARVDTDTDASVVWDLITGVWNVKQPGLVISVTGGESSCLLNTRLKQVIKAGLKTAALRTDTWIISGGTHTGVTKYVGEAIRDLDIKVSPRKEVVALGIATWGCVSNREALIDDKEITRYRIEPPSHASEAPIDCNHSHVILVDDGTQHRPGVETDFRARLEQTISDQSDARIIVVVVNGGQDTLLAVYNALQNLTPVLIIEGSGGVADILAFAYENSNEYAVKVTDRSGKTHQQSIRVMSECTERKIAQRLGQIFMDNEEDELRKYLDWIKQCLLFADRISVFSLDSGTIQDMDLAILKGLLKANQEDAFEQLQLALIWDRVDVAKADIYTEGLLFESGKLNAVLFSAFELNRVDFVEMFIKGGVCLRDFLTTETLIRLYNITMSERPALYAENGKRQSTKQRVNTLDDIGRLINSLMGDNYVSVYPEKVSKENPEAESPESDEEQKRDLFIWSVLVGRCAMAKLLWNEISNGIAAGLVACVLLKALGKREKDNKLKQQLEGRALEFQQLAVHLMNSCYEENEEKTFKLLLRQQNLWGNISCINIAIHFHNKVFMAEPVCQALVQKKWWGTMDESCSYLTLVPCLFVPVLLFPCLKFQTVEESAGDTEGTDQDTSSQTHLFARGDKYTKRFMRAESAPVRPSSIHTRQRNGKEKIWGFFSAPVTVFCYNTIFFLSFLGLYSYVMLIEFHADGPCVREIILEVWVLTLFIEELRQLWRFRGNSVLATLRRYLSVRWNILDMVTFVTFFCGFVFRFFAATFDTARIILAMNLFGFFVRLLHIYSENKILGPKLVMISKMFEDLWGFMFILLVFITGYGVSAHSILYPNSEPNSMLFLDIYRQAYWPMFGELLLEEIEYVGRDRQECDVSLTTNDNGTAMRCPTETGKVAVPILLALYLLLTNILLLNLLIAVFSNTFQAVQNNADLHWPLLRYKLLEEYYDKPFLPPPFSVVVEIYKLIHSSLKCCRVPKSEIFPVYKGINSQEIYSLCMFENKKRLECLSKIAKDVQETTNHQIKSTSDRVDFLMGDIRSIADRLSSLDRSIEDRLLSLETSLNSLMKQISSLSKQQSEQVGFQEFPDCGPPPYPDMLEETDSKSDEGNERNPRSLSGRADVDEVEISVPRRVVHPVVTRWKRDSSGTFIRVDGERVREFIALRRLDNKLWSLPDGFIESEKEWSDVGILNTMKTVLGDLIETEERKLNELLSLNSVTAAFTGYTGDSRTEVTAVNFHDETGKVTTEFKLKPGKSGDLAAWLPALSTLPLHANHAFILKKVLTKIQQ